MSLNDDVSSEELLIDENIDKALEYIKHIVSKGKLTKKKRKELLQDLSHIKRYVISDFKTDDLAVVQKYSTEYEKRNIPFDKKE